MLNIKKNKSTKAYDIKVDLNRSDLQTTIMIFDLYMKDINKNANTSEIEKTKMKYQKSLTELNQFLKRMK